MAEKNFGFEGFLGTQKKNEMGQRVENSEKRKRRVLDYYEDKMKNGELLCNLSFSQSERAEGVFFFEEGIKILLPKEEIMAGYVTANLDKESLKRIFTVKVIEVDREKECVKVSLIQAQAMVRPGVLKTINKVLAEGRVYKTSARISYITSSNTLAFVDILGLGIRGVVFAREWSVGFTRDISMLAKVGDIIDIAITKKTEKYTEESPQYECSRKATFNFDPWKDIEVKAPLHSNVVVTCVYKERNNYLGKINGLDELTAYCLYPEKDSPTTGEPIVIHKGGVYSGYVSGVSEEKRILRVRTLDELSSVE